MLNFFVRKAHQRNWLVHPRVVIGVPSQITPVEQRAVLDSAYRAKAREVYLVDQAMMGALGAGLPVTEPGGNLIVDIGGGTTDVAVISLSGVVYSRSVRTAGNAMDNAITDYLKYKHNLLIGDRTAERVKIEVGSAYSVGRELQTEVKGRDMHLGRPKTVTVNDAEIREALAPMVAVIITAVRNALEHTPPELSGDICERGVVITGGGALLRGLDQSIRHNTGLPVTVAAEPLTSVVTGAGQMLNDLKMLRKMSVN
jgi:rod shape-determining protein MreB